MKILVHLPGIPEKTGDPFLLRKKQFYKSCGFNNIFEITVLVCTV